MIPAEIRTLLDHQETRRSTFDESTLRAFKNVWQQRLTDAKEYHKREDLRLSAEAVLKFINDRLPEDIQLCICRQEQKLMAVLLDERASEFLIMGN